MMSELVFSTLKLFAKKDKVSIELFSLIVPIDYIDEEWFFNI
jgi:hypothetical protein